VKNNTLHLKNVTLLSANGASDSDLSLAALQVSSRHIQFGAIKLLAAAAPSRIIPSHIEFISIPKMDLEGYNRFSIKNFVKYADTDFVLIVQPDGFVLNLGRWQSRFLNYDYIGAPWPEEFCGKFPNYRVGNSGFCLRSRRFLEEAARLYYSRGSADDVFFCRRKREILESKGIRYAPPKIAANFSVEFSVPENPGADLRNVFGFHGGRVPQTRRFCEWLRNWNKRRMMK
jgi:hypothetical protein